MRVVSSAVGGGGSCGAGCVHAGPLLAEALLFLVPCPLLVGVGFGLATEFILPLAGLPLLVPGLEAGVACCLLFGGGFALTFGSADVGEGFEGAGPLLGGVVAAAAPGAGDACTDAEWSWEVDVESHDPFSFMVCQHVAYSGWVVQSTR